MPLLSWITGWVNCSGWVALVATGGLLGSQLVLGCISLMNPVCTVPVFTSDDSAPNDFIRHMSLSAGISS
jgi:hypothetical protein